VVLVACGLLEFPKPEMNTSYVLTTKIVCIFFFNDFCIICTN
jgi:hypothetical protein